MLTTQELAQMIEAAGIRFSKLQPESLDMPFGFTTGAGVLFGDSGGVTEAVLRFAVEKITGTPLRDVDFETVRGESGLREANLTVDGQVLKLAIVHGLANARVVAEKVKAGNADYDLIEVMACPGGCIGGAGQPVSRNPEVNSQRTRGLYKADKSLQLHKSQDNVFVTECYTKFLGEVGGEKAHHLLHTGYQSRRRIADESMSLLGRPSQEKIRVDVCLGTNCYLKGSQAILNKLMDHVNEEGLENAVDIRASFCFENCEHGPTVKVGARRSTNARWSGLCKRSTTNCRGPSMVARRVPTARQRVYEHHDLRRGCSVDLRSTLGGRNTPQQGGNRRKKKLFSLLPRGEGALEGRSRMRGHFLRREIKP